MSRCGCWSRCRRIFTAARSRQSEPVHCTAADPKHLGAQIGLTSVLHTWGSAMTHHPHAAGGEGRLAVVLGPDG
jgi:hypothetical protein